MTALTMLLQNREDVFVKDRWGRRVYRDRGPEHSGDRQALHLRRLDSLAALIVSHLCLDYKGHQIACFVA